MTHALINPIMRDPKTGLGMAAAAEWEKDHFWERFADLAARFSSTFGYPLIDFYSPITGFDVITFENRLYYDATPDGKSLRDVVREDKGEAAVGLIEALIRLER